ncbi:MAG: hypothetical protein IPP36_12825 [Nitrosomonadales bacterium]|nr:hypothetical protein [Nitrosomonadales bacterium]
MNAFYFADYFDYSLFIFDNNVSLDSPCAFFAPAADSKGIFNLDTFWLVSVNSL